MNKDDVVDDFENYNINGRLLWEPTDDLSVDLRAHYGEVDAASISFNAAFALADAAAFTGVSELFEDVNEHAFNFQPNIDPDNDQESFDISIKADYDMDWATLTGWFLYSDIDQSFLADGTSAAFSFFDADPNCIASAASTASVIPCRTAWDRALTGGLSTVMTVTAPCGAEETGLIGCSLVKHECR